MGKLIVGVALIGGFLAGCSDPVVLPDRTDPAVQAEEARIGDVLETVEEARIGDVTGSADAILVPRPRECAVRLLGQDGDTSYVWANCFGPLDGPERPGIGAPVRIDGDRVWVPGDGSQYGEDIEEMFPADIAKAIFDGGERISP